MFQYQFSTSSVLVFLLLLVAFTELVKMNDKFGSKNFYKLQFQNLCFPSFLCIRIKRTDAVKIKSVIGNEPS